MARPLEPIDTAGFAGQIGARIRARRLKLRLSVEDCAGRAGAPVPTWYNWETGRHLALDRLPAIAEALNCRPRTLLPP